MEHGPAAQAIGDQKRDGVHFEIALNKAVAEQLPEMMSLEPRDLGDYSSGKPNSVDLDEGWPSQEEVMALIRQEQKKGYNYDMATTRVGARLLEAQRAAPGGGAGGGELGWNGGRRGRPKFILPRLINRDRF